MAGDGTMIVVIVAAAAVLLSVSLSASLALVFLASPAGATPPPAAPPKGPAPPAKGPAPPPKGPAPPPKGPGPAPAPPVEEWDPATLPSDKNRVGGGECLYYPQSYNRFKKRWMCRGDPLTAFASGLTIAKNGKDWGRYACTATQKCADNIMSDFGRKGQAYCSQPGCMDGYRGIAGAQDPNDVMVAGLFTKDGKAYCCKDGDRVYYDYGSRSMKCTNPERAVPAICH